MGEHIGGGFAGIHHIFIVIPAVVELPVRIVDVQLQTILGSQILRICTVNHFYPQIEGVGAVVFNADFLGNHIAGENVDTLCGECSTLISFFVNDQLDITGGHHIGRFSDSLIICKCRLTHKDKQSSCNRNHSDLQFHFAKHSVSSFLGCHCEPVNTGVAICFQQSKGTSSIVIARSIAKRLCDVAISSVQYRLPHQSADWFAMTEMGIYPLIAAYPPKGIGRTYLRNTYLTVAFAMPPVTRVLRFSAVKATPPMVQFSKVTAPTASTWKPAAKSQPMNWVGP